MVNGKLIAFLVLGILIASFSSFINVQGGADDPAVRKFISAKCDEACATSCDGSCASEAFAKDGALCGKLLEGCGQFERLWNECMAECTSGYAARQAKEAADSAEKEKNYQLLGALSDFDSDFNYLPVDEANSKITERFGGSFPPLSRNGRFPNLNYLQEHNAKANSNSYVEIQVFDTGIFMMGAFGSYGGYNLNGIGVHVGEAIKWPGINPEGLTKKSISGGKPDAKLKGADWAKVNTNTVTDQKTGKEVIELEMQVDSAAPTGVQDTNLVIVQDGQEIANFSLKIDVQKPESGESGGKTEVQEPTSSKGGSTPADNSGASPSETPSSTSDVVIGMVIIVGVLVAVGFGVWKGIGLLRKKKSARSPEV